MAVIRKQGNSWRADVKKLGTRKSACFPTKAAATAWAVKIENDLLNKQNNVFNSNTLTDALERYKQEISPKKKSHVKEVFRINSFIKNFPDLATKKISSVGASDISRWRDVRLSEVSAASVLREMNIFRNVFNVARREWEWCSHNPFDAIKKPATPAPRDRRISNSEIKRICRELCYITGKIETKSQEVALAFLISLRTGMRSGEILSLNSKRANLTDRVLTVPHKTQHITGKERQIPITKQAARLVGYLEKRGEYFTVSDASRDALFRKARDAQGLNDLNFHDARAEALTRLSRRVDVMTLAKISGHSDLRILQNTYYRETAKDIAARL